MSAPFKAPRIVSRNERGGPSRDSNCDTISIDLWSSFGGPEPTDVADIAVTVEHIEVDRRPRFRVERVRSRDSFTREDSPYRKLTYRIVNEGWSDAVDLHLELVDDVAARLFPSAALHKRFTIASGMNDTITIYHRDIDPARVREAQDQTFRRMEEHGFKVQLASDYQAHLARLRGPAQDIREVELRNYLKMTALGHDWKLPSLPAPAPALPADTPELYDAFRQEWLASKAARCVAADEPELPVAGFDGPAGRDGEGLLAVAKDGLTITVDPDGFDADLRWPGSTARHRGSSAGATKHHI